MTAKISRLFACFLLSAVLIPAQSWGAWGNVENTDFTLRTAGNSSSVTAEVTDLSPSDGDALVYVVSSHGNRTFTTPSGLTLVSSEVGTSAYTYLFEKEAGASEADVVFTASSSGDLAAWVFLFPGDYAAGTIVDVSAHSSGGGLDDSPSITPTEDPTTVFACYFDQSGYQTPTVPTGMTLVKDNDFNSENKQEVCAYEDYTGTSATGVMSWHNISGTTGHVSFAVKVIEGDVTAPVLTSAGTSDIKPGTADLDVTTDEGNGTLYYVVTSSATAPSAAQVKAGQDHTSSAAIANGSQSISTTGAKTFNDVSISDGTRYAHFMHEDAAANQSTVASTTSFSIDGTAPVLTSASASDLQDGGTADLNVTTDEGNGTLYYVVSDSATTPTATQIKAGQDHTSSAAIANGSQAIGTTGAKTFNNVSITPGTRYAHFMHEDAATNESTAVSTASFTINASGDSTAPILSAASANDLQDGGTADLNVTTDEGNGTLYYVVTDSATAPSAAQVKAGQDHTSSAGLAMGNQAISTTGAKTFNDVSITAGTRYAHFMHEDAATNQSTVVSTASFTINALAARTSLFCPSIGRYVTTDQLVCDSQDCCPPILTNLTVSDIGDADADTCVTTNKGTGTLYVGTLDPDNESADCFDLYNDTETVFYDRKSVAVTTAGQYCVDDVGGMASETEHKMMWCHAWQGRPLGRGERNRSNTFTTAAPPSSDPPTTPGSGGQIHVVDWNGSTLPADMSPSNSNPSVQIPATFSSSIKPTGATASWSPFVIFNRDDPYSGFRHELTPKHPSILRMDYGQNFKIRIYYRTGPNWENNWRTEGEMGATIFQIHGAPDKDLGEAAGRNPTFALRIADDRARPGKMQFTSTVQGSSVAINSVPKENSEFDRAFFSGLDVPLETWFRVDFETVPCYTFSGCSPMMKVTIFDGTEETVFFNETSTLTAFNDIKAPFAKFGLYAVAWKVFRTGQPAIGTERKLYVGPVIFGRNVTWSEMNTADIGSL